MDSKKTTTRARPGHSSNDLKFINKKSKKWGENNEYL